MRYQIIASQSLSDLERMINCELAHDWIPAGGLISYTAKTNDPDQLQPVLFFAQAMITHAPLPKASS